MPAVPKYSGLFGQAELLHLLRRCLFGVNNADLKVLKGKSLDTVVDQLLTFSTNVTPPLKAYSLKVNNVQDPTAIDTNVKFGETWVNTPINGQTTGPDGYRKESFKAWRTGLLINQELNLRESLTLFWHNHFSTDTNEIPSILPYQTNQLHRTNCLANLKKILTDISLDITMLRYLNGYLNTAKAPDENYGREVQELFAIGKGPGSGYTEDDVKAAAKVLSGWSYIFTDIANTKLQAMPRILPNPINTSENTARQANHSLEVKQFSAFYNNTKFDAIAKSTDVNYDVMKAELDKLIDMFLATDECARHIVRRFYIYFIHYVITPETEQNFIIPLAAQYKSSNYDIKAMLKLFFTSAEFFSSCNRGAMIKSPATFMVSLLRQFGMQLPTGAQLEAQYSFRSTIKNYGPTMAQDFTEAPDVAGWPAYYQTPQFHEIWVNTATYPTRKTFYENMINSGISPGAAFFEDASKNLKFVIDFVEFAKTFSNPSDPNVLINESCTLLFGSAVSQSVKDQLKKNYLLNGQSTDYYWTNAYNAYVANPNTTDPDAKKVPSILKNLYLDMCGAAEYHLC
ncbi:MAG: DUF1800 family protein [Saprospiraceae bacterium]